MPTAFAQFGHWILLAALGAGFGVPLGLPPAPDDPVIASVAPAECILYTSWAGVGTAASDSKNQTERLLAEPEVRRFLGFADKWFRSLPTETAGDASDSDANSTDASDANAEVLKLCLTHPTAVFLSDLNVVGDKAVFHGGLVTSFGAQAKIAKALIDSRIRPLALSYGVQSVETVHLRGQDWYRVKISDRLPELLVGFEDTYFIVAIGDGSLDAIVARMKQPPPAWLTDIFKRLPIDRPTALTYIDLARLRDSHGPWRGDEQIRAAIDLLGLSNAAALISVTGMEGETVLTRTLLKLDGEPRALLGAVTGQTLSGKDLAAIPRDATLALVARINLQTLVDSYLAAAEKSAPSVRSALIAPLDDLRKESQIDFRHGFFDALGDTWCVYNSPGEGGYVASGLTCVVPIKNRGAFSLGYKKVLDLVPKSMDGDPFGGNGQPFRIRRFRFEDHDVHYFVFLDMIAPAWCATEKELVVALTAQNVKAYLSRPAGSESLAAVPEVARELESPGKLILLGYSDTPKLFEAFYPLVTAYAPAMLSGKGDDSQTDPSILPSAPSIGRHLRPGLIALHRTKDGLELTIRRSMPGLELLVPGVLVGAVADWFGLPFSNDLQAGGVLLGAWGVPAPAAK